MSLGVHHSYVVEIDATNVAASIDPSQFARRLK
jgi:hypothetical protein